MHFVVMTTSRISQFTALNEVIKYRSVYVEKRVQLEEFYLGNKKIEWEIIV